MTGGCDGSIVAACGTAGDAERAAAILTIGARIPAGLNIGFVGAEKGSKKGVRGRNGAVAIFGEGSGATLTDDAGIIDCDMGDGDCDGEDDFIGMLGAGEGRVV